ncbi:hydroxypyruvate isomerase family protein [Hoeflea sp. Naph1]|uniref:hydroxypyruvate isomerase family protein n=1 Tax=Hoeflea sp. Naph1 TaxID=3388653 RepID=UPI00398FE010
MMFQELPFLERFSAAQRAGFGAVEIQYPYGFTIADLSAACREVDIPLVLFNASRGSGKEDRGLACLPGREVEFRNSIEVALDYSAALGNRFIHVLSGVPTASVASEETASVWQANIKWAADRTARAGVGIVIEALNHHDVPGYYIASPAHAVDLIRSLDIEKCGILFDAYHCARSGLPVVETMLPIMAFIQHIQIADVPMRTEPGSGHINWASVFSAIENSSYTGFVGAEYTPANTTLDGLAWAIPYLENSK